MNENKTPATRVKTIYSTLKALGYPKSYIEGLLPDWWDNALLKTSAGLFQFALLLKQRLGINVAFDTDGELILNENSANVLFKHRKGTLPSELSLSSNLAMALSNMIGHYVANPYVPIPTDPQLLRNNILKYTDKNYIDFDALLKMCWGHGIPVLFLSKIPQNAKKFAGMVCNVGGRPVIFLGFKHTHKARQLFILAHELGHIAKEHLLPNQVLIDEEISDVVDAIESIVSKSSFKDAQEVEADKFALDLIRNNIHDPLKEIGTHYSPTTLAASAMDIGYKYCIDPAHIIMSYAKANNDWARANQALNFCSDVGGAIEHVRRIFMENIEMDALSNENQEYLKSILGIID